MRNVIYIIFFIFILCSCNSNNDLKGIWIGAYEIDYFKNDSSLSSIRLLLDFSNDEVTFKTFDYPMFDEKENTEKAKYFINDNYLIIESDTFQIESLTKDSLILLTNSDSKNKLVFRKLIEKDIDLNIDIVGKAFLLQGPNYKDSIDFINDSTILHIGNVFNTRYRSSNWSINNHKNLTFLVIDQHDSPPFLIENTFENELSLKLFSTNTKDFRLSLIQNKNDTTGLLGNWISPNPNNPDIPLPPSPINSTDNNDVRLYLKIKTDSLEIEQFGKSNKKSWKLNSNNNFIYFHKELDEAQGVWKILELDKDNLIIERNSRSSFTNEKEKILFKREKNSR